MTDRELLQMALDWIEAQPEPRMIGAWERIKALRTALAQPEPDPVAWWHDRGDVVDLNVSGHGTPLYFAPPKREWVGLTNEEIMEITGVKSTDSDWNVVIVHKWIRAIEAKLKEKNSG